METENRNLRSSTEILKTALGAMARERDNYKDRFLSADQEMRTRLASVEYLEARHRAHMQLLKESERLGAQATNAVAALQKQLDDQSQRYGDYDVNLAGLQKELGEKTETVTSVSEALSRAEEDVTRLVTENATLQARVTSDMKQGDERVEKLDQGIAAAQLQVQELKRELIDVKRERDAAVAGVVENAKPTQGPQPTLQVAATPSATGFLVNWWNRSVAEISEGRFNDDNRLLLALLGTFLIFLSLTFFFMARASSARSRVRALRKQFDGVSQQTAMPLRADEISPAVAQVGAEAEELAATMQMDDGLASQATAPDQLGKTQMLGTTSSISRELDDVLGGGHDSEATMMIPTAAEPEESFFAEDSEGADDGDAETVHDDDLFSDLKSAIQEKFAELRDK